MPRFRGRWLEYVNGPPEWLQETDLLSTEWIGKPGKCWNVAHPEDPHRFPWWHPRFVFRVPVHLVRIRLTKMETPTRHGQKLWDIIFNGRPGNDFTVVNQAVPVGCRLCQLPEFCPPLRADALYELRVTEMGERPRFDEHILLRPRTDQNFQEATSVVMQEDDDALRPRPALKTPWQDGAVSARWRVKFDPETGEPEEPIMNFL